MAYNKNAPGSPQSSQDSDELFLSSKYMTVKPPDGSSQSQSQSQSQSDPGPHNEGIVDLSEPWDPSPPFSPGTIDSQSQTRSSRARNEPVVDLSEPWDPAHPYIPNDGNRLISSQIPYPAPHPLPPPSTQKLNSDDDDKDSLFLSKKYMKPRHSPSPSPSPSSSVSSCHIDQHPRESGDVWPRIAYHKRPSYIATAKIELTCRTNLCRYLRDLGDGSTLANAKDVDINAVVQRVYASLKLQNHPALGHFETAGLSDEELVNIPFEGDIEFLDIVARHWSDVMMRK